MPNDAGMYRAAVHDIADPEDRGRLRLLVPAVLGDAPSGWAEPALPTSVEPVWEVGDKVWVLFEGGDINKPVYISRMEVRREDLAPGAVGPDQISPEVPLGPNAPTEVPSSSPDIRVTGDQEGLIVVTSEIDPTTVLDYYIDGDLHPSNTGTRSTVVYLTTNASGDPLEEEQDYLVHVQARNIIGPADPSPTVVGRLNSSVPPELVIARLNAALANFRSITVGGITVDANSGITLDLLNGGRIAIPADGSDVVLRGVSIETDNAVVNGVLRILGLDNNVEGVLTLSASTPAPQVAPEVSNVVRWRLFSWANPLYPFPSEVEGIAMHDGLLYVADRHSVSRWNADGTMDWRFTMPSDDWLSGVTVHPTTGKIYALRRPAGTNPETGMRVVVLEASPPGATTAPALDRVFSTVGTTRHNTIGYDPATDKILVCGVVPGSSGTGSLRVQRHSPEQDGVPSTSSTSSANYNSNQHLYGVHVGLTDDGTTRMYLGSQLTYADVQSASSTSPHNRLFDDWFPNRDNLRGLAWDAVEGRWVTAHWEYGSPCTIVRHSKFKGGTSESVTYSFYDSNPAGDGTHETTPSPPRTVTRINRSWLKVATGPVDNDGDVDAPDSVRVYLSNNLQGSLPLGVTTGYYENRLVGSPAKTVNEFSGLSKFGVIRSEAEDGEGRPLVLLGGDGSGRVGPWEWDDSGELTKPAWESFAPHWGASNTNPSIGNGTLTGRYRKVGTTVNFTISMIAGSTTNFGSGYWSFHLPFPVRAPTDIWAFTGRAWNVAGGGPVHFLEADTGTGGGTSCIFRTLPTDPGALLRVVNANNPFVWAAGDRWTIHGTYESQ